MKLPIALATLFLAATTALPAFAANAAPRHAVQVQQDHRSGINAYAAAPRDRRVVYGWGHCVSSSLDSGARSAFPSWDVCGRG